MHSVVLAVVVSLTVAVSADMQDRPNFSGSWRLDPSRSDAAAHTDSPGPVTEIITHTDTQIQIATTTSRGTMRVSYAFPSTDQPVKEGTPIAQWRGDTLLTDVIRDVRGQSVTVQQTRSLSADGNEMVVESVVNVQHGYSAVGAKIYGASKDVFVRVSK
jgi:hypothetical protein